MKTLLTLLVGTYLFSGMQVMARVIISSPSNGTTVSSPARLIASDASRTQPESMSVYVNGVSILQKQAVSSMPPGSNHAIEVLAHYRHRSVAAATHITVVSASLVTPPPSPEGAVSVAEQTAEDEFALAATTCLAPSAASTAEQIAADMQGKNEGFPHGVPLSWDWANGPVVDMGNNSKGQNAITSWGIVYVAAQGNPATNTRVNIRNVQVYLLQKNEGTWLLLQSTSAPDGAAYPEDYQGPSVAGDVRTEPDGTISVTAGHGYNFHFYPSDRGSIDSNDIGGIVAIFDARLIVGNPALPDDRSIAQYLAGAGADYYQSVTGPGQDNNPSVANGKLKYVKTSWRSFAMTTLTQTQLQKNPPPINLTGLLP